MGALKLPGGVLPLQLQANLVHIIALKSDNWCMALSLLIFVRINEHAGQLLVGPHALWPTLPKFWGLGQRCSAPPLSLQFFNTSNKSIIRFASIYLVSYCMDTVGQMLRFE